MSDETRQDSQLKLKAMMATPEDWLLARNSPSKPYGAAPDKETEREQ
jgi:hypothetical protein